MRDVILASPQQISHSLEVNKDVKVAGDFDSIILAGMGGSGHPGDLINALGISNVPLFVHRNYDLPLAYIGHLGFSKTLVITSSYSGNTEESLSAYEAARKHKIPLLGSAAGGTLKDWCQRDNVPFCLIDFPNMQPRHTLFAAFTGIYTALKNSGLVRDISDELQTVAAKLTKTTPTLEEAAKQLAQKIKGKIPVYYSTDNLGFAAKNFKIQTNENAKHPAFWNVFPELNHNEMIGMSELASLKNPAEFLAVMIRDRHDHPRNKARIDVTSEMFRKWGVAVEEFVAPGTTLLEKILATVMFGMWTTYYLAKEYGLDPVPVAGVEDFKQKLKDIAG